MSSDSPVSSSQSSSHSKYLASHPMKYVENQGLENVVNFINSQIIGSAKLNSKCEVFSFQKGTHASSQVASTMSTIIEDKNTEKSSTKSTTDTATGADTGSTTTGTGTDTQTSSGPFLEPWSPSGVSKPISIRRKRSNSNTIDTANNGWSIKLPARKRSSSLGDLSKPSAQRLLISLISTLNDFFPDYDFITTKADQFVSQNINNVIGNVNSHFAELTAVDPLFLQKLWQSIDEAIVMRKCEVFTYVPLPYEDDDPIHIHSFWSFNYFFYNEDSQKICCFMCVASNKYNHPDNDFNVTGDYDDYDDDDEYYNNDDNEDYDDAFSMNCDTDDDDEGNAGGDFEGII